MTSIMVVEDHADSREALAILLRRSGYKVTCAEDGRQALGRIVDHAPDLVVMDLNMPDMNGVDLIESLRSYVRLHFLPVVILTAAPDGELARRAKSMQVGGVLTKGKATIQEILGVIEHTLEESVHRRETMHLEKWRNDEISPL